ncbi:uncharacterized protein BKA78DRAFT_67277 [Phyllosticta capitalensis]|uniref:uncharacterized protein n=1 Tax=Phyllosticta capitalensis TaxID=121624 RepID=UPI00312F60D3
MAPRNHSPRIQQIPGGLAKPAQTPCSYAAKVPEYFSFHHHRSRLLWSPAHYCTTSRTFLQTTYLSPSSRRLPCARFGFGKKLAPPHSLIGEPGDDSMGTKRRMWTNMHPDHACARLVLLRHATHYAGVVGFSLALLLFWSWRCREMQSGRGTEGWETWRRLMFCMRCGKVSMNQDISSCCLLLRC